MNPDSELQFSQHAPATNDAVHAEDSHIATEMIPNVAELDASESNKSEAQLQLFKDIEDWLKEFQQKVLKAQDSEPPADIVIAFEDVRAKMEGFLNEHKSSDWMLKLAMATSQFARDIQEDYEDIEELAQITLRFQRNVSIIKAGAGLGNDVMEADENSTELSHSEVVTKVLETESPLSEKSSSEKELGQRDEIGDLDYTLKNDWNKGDLDYTLKNDWNEVDLDYTPKSDWNEGDLDYTLKNDWNEEDAVQSHEPLEKVRPEFTGAESEGAEVDNAQTETHTQTPTESDILNRLSPQMNQTAEELEINLPPAMPEKVRASSVKDPASPKKSLRSESSQDLIPQNQSFQEESGKEEPPKDDYTKQKCFEIDTTDDSDTEPHNNNMHKPNIEFQLHKTNGSELEAQADEAVNLELETQTDKADNLEADSQADIPENLEMEALAGKSDDVEVEAQVNEADRSDTDPQISSPLTENNRTATLKDSKYFEKFLELPKKQPNDPRNPGVMEDLSKMPRKGLVKQRVEAMEREQAKLQAQEYAYMKERRGLSDSDQEMP